MPREEIVKIYTFDELSKKAKERAVQDWREKGHDFDSHDADRLTEDFQETLKERGFDDGVTANWSLGYCQGDGVCFSGTIDPKELVKEKGFSKWEKLAPHVSIKVSHGRRDCHWNSMTVEIVQEANDFQDLIPRELDEEISDWEVEQSRITRAYANKVSEVVRDRELPIREWEREIKRYDGQKGVLDWLPDRPVKPGLLDIPLPPEPQMEDEPEKFVRAKEKAQAEFNKMEAQVDELQEDVKEWVSDLSRELEKMGYEEIEYQGSEEAVGEILMANDYEFYDDGEMVK